MAQSKLDQFQKDNFPIGLVRNKNSSGIGMVRFFSNLTLFRPIIKMRHPFRQDIVLPNNLLLKSSLSNDLVNCYCNYVFVKE